MLRRLLHWLFDRGEPIQYGPLDEEPPPVRNWGDAVAESRPRPMDEPANGLQWPTDEDD